MHREEQDSRSNGYSIFTTRRIQTAWESDPALLPTAAQCHSTNLELLPCKLETLPSAQLYCSQHVQGRDCPLTSCLSPTILNTIHNKRFYTTKFKKYLA